MISIATHSRSPWCTACRQVQVYKLTKDGGRIVYMCDLSLNVVSRRKECVREEYVKLIEPKD